MKTMVSCFLIELEFNVKIHHKVDKLYITCTTLTLFFVLFLNTNDFKIKDFQMENGGECLC